MFIRNKKGQSVLEYVIVLVLIVAAIIVGARGFFSTQVSKSFDDAGAAISSATTRLTQ